MRILLLVHRVPFPPDKGDKIRSFRLMDALCRRHEVHLITHADDPRDLAGATELARSCRSVHIAPISPFAAKRRLVGGLLRGEALSVAHFIDGATQALVTERIRQLRPDAIVVYSSQPVRYLPEQLDIPVIVDLVDVDSEKWLAYANEARPPMAWVYRREARLVQALEAEIARRGYQIVVVSEREARTFREHVAESEITVIPNGVDLPPEDAPRAPREPGLMVFVGAMDYPANAEAVRRGAEEILPRVRQAIPDARFRIVGRNPTRLVRALGRLPGVEVTGAVDSVVPHLRAASMSLVPLSIARGVPNKVLEAFAYRVPVVATPDVREALSATAEEHLLVGRSTDDLASQSMRLLNDPALAGRIGAAARALVADRYRWDRTAAAFQALVVRATAKEVVG